jgi:hypothetical protein
MLPATSRSDPPARPGRLARLLAWLRRHPVVGLLLLTPGIPEYLSSSSSLTLLILNPVAFLLFLGANLGLYGPGVLLIREAKVRWRAGWGSVILLAIAYGILEEGVALGTLFNPAAGPVGTLGSYGHWMGVSWVWSAGVLMVHVVFSISIPILLLGMALPATRAEPWWSNRGIVALVGILSVDVGTLFTLVWKGFGFWMGWPIFLLCFGTIGALVAIARRLPRRLLLPVGEGPTARPRTFFLLGLALFPGTLLLEAVLGSIALPAAVAVGSLVAFDALLLAAGRAWLGRHGHEPHLLAFCAGALAPLALFGFLASLPLPVVAAADLAIGLFLLRLWRRVSRTAEGAGRLPLPTAAIPPGAL